VDEWVAEVQASCYGVNLAVVGPRVRGCGLGLFPQNVTPRPSEAEELLPQAMTPFPFKAEEFFRKL
jgi:hypothetical protein